MASVWDKVSKKFPYYFRVAPKKPKGILLFHELENYYTNLFGIPYLSRNTSDLSDVEIFLKRNPEAHWQRVDNAVFFSTKEMRDLARENIPFKFALTNKKLTLTKKKC